MSISDVRCRGCHQHIGSVSVWGKDGPYHLACARPAAREVVKRAIDADLLRAKLRPKQPESTK